MGIARDGEQWYWPSGYGVVRLVTRVVLSRGALRLRLCRRLLILELELIFRSTPAGPLLLLPPSPGILRYALDERRRYNTLSNPSTSSFLPLTRRFPRLFARKHCSTSLEPLPFAFK